MLKQPPRVDIRRAMRARLVGVRRARGRVFIDRSAAFRHTRGGGELPALCLHTLGETPVPSMTCPKEYRRAATFGVEVIVARGHARAADVAGCSVMESEMAVADRICEDVEQVLLADPTLGGIIRELRYRRTSFDFDDRTEVPLGSALVEFDAIYYTEHVERATLDAVGLLRCELQWVPGTATSTSLTFRDMVAMRD